MVVGSQTSIIFCISMFASRRRCPNLFLSGPSVCFSTCQKHPIMFGNYDAFTNFVYIIAINSVNARPRFVQRRVCRNHNSCSHVLCDLFKSHFISARTPYVEHALYSNMRFGAEQDDSGLERSASYLNSSSVLLQQIHHL